MNSSTMYVEIEPAKIVDINRIFEGYEYLALVSTVDRQRAVVKLRGTPDTMPEVEKVVKHLPFPAKILEDFREY